MPVADLPDRVDEAPTPEQAAVVRTMPRSPSLLQKLPEAQREILILRVAVGMSTEETAVAIGMTPARCGSHSTGPRLAPHDDGAARGR